MPETWCYCHFLCMFASSRLIALCTPNCKSLWIKASAKRLNVNVNVRVLFCTYVLVVDGHKHINDALHSQHPETKHDQQLEQDVAFRPHVRHQQTHLLPKIFPCRLILIRITQQRLQTCKRCINKINYYYRSKI